MVQGCVAHADCLGIASMPWRMQHYQALAPLLWSSFLLAVLLWSLRTSIVHEEMLLSWANSFEFTCRKHGPLMMGNGCMYLLWGWKSSKSAESRETESNGLWKSRLCVCRPAAERHLQLSWRTFMISALSICRAGYAFITSFWGWKGSSCKSRRWTEKMCIVWIVCCLVLFDAGV